MSAEYFAHSGLRGKGDRPRPLAWAVLSRPFGAAEGKVYRYDGADSEKCSVRSDVWFGRKVLEVLTRSGLVFLGAGIGANARYWLGAWISERTPVGFPWGTFVVNVTGSLLIGLLLGVLIEQNSPLSWRLFLIVGLLGGYTTFSSFSMESINLLRDKSYGYAALYVLGSCLLSFAATAVGLMASKLFAKT